MTSHTAAEHFYEVQVGHAKVRVQGRSPQDAIARARQQLKAEMPRLYDMIQQIDDTRFSVMEMTQPK